jgi:hypothetical protein
MTVWVKILEHVLVICSRMLCEHAPQSSLQIAQNICGAQSPSHGIWQVFSSSKLGEAVIPASTVAPNPLSWRKDMVRPDAVQTASGREQLSKENKGQVRILLKYLRATPGALQFVGARLMALARSYLRRVRAR